MALFTTQPISPTGSVNKEDLMKWFHNTLLFAGPVLIVVIGVAIKDIPKGWQYGAYVLYALNVLTDLLQKFLDNNH